MATPLKFSPQQEAFFRFAKTSSASCVLEAVAGAGKTTTLLESINHFAGQIAIVAFNKAIAEEIKAKLTKRGVDWKKAQAGTVHSFGLNAYRKTFNDVKVDTRGEKLDELIANYLQRVSNDSIVHAYTKVIRKVVSLAKQRAVGVLSSLTDRREYYDIITHFDVFDPDDERADQVTDDVITAAIEVLKANNRRTDWIDFDDMIYMTLVHKCRMWQFDVVMVDEAQDTNAARRALVRMMTKRGGRVIAVGDPHQAIYGFTGADSDALDLIASDFNAIRMPLTVSYRCPKAVVNFARQWVNHIESAANAPEGKVEETDVEAFVKRNDLDGSSAVLCRVTKPLVQLAFMLIRNRIACKIEGRDIAEGLKKLATRWKRIKTASALRDKLEDHLASQTQKLLARKKENEAQALEDRVETIKVIIDQVIAEKNDSVDAVVKFLDQLFDDNVRGILVLSTIHKSKGREWPNVFWYDRQGTCPSKWARQKWQQEQEVNLMYVAATRSMSALYDLAP